MFIYLVLVYIRSAICIYTSIYGTRARSSSPKLIGMSDVNSNTCNVCHVWHGNSRMHLEHMISDSHNWLCNLKLLDRVVFWCRYCHGPVQEPLSQHIVEYTHASRVHEAVCPDHYWPEVFHPPCAPAQCFVMHREPQLVMTPELKSQCLNLYADALYERHMAMHPHYHFGPEVARDDDAEEEQEVILLD